MSKTNSRVNSKNGKKTKETTSVIISLKTKDLIKKIQEFEESRDEYIGGFISQEKIVGVCVNAIHEMATKKNIPLRDFIEKNL